MIYQIRKATAQDIKPALDLALRVFMEYDSLQYGPEHTERMRTAIKERLDHFDIYLSGKRLMFVALDSNKVIGIIETYGTNRISLMFVDNAYQRQGIATALMRSVACELKKTGYNEIVLNSSPYGVRFYTKFGFTINEAEKDPNTPWKTPMSYKIE